MTRADLLHRWRTCGRKVAFLSREAARETARKLHPTATLAVYECPFCGQWHYGRRRRERAKEAA